MMFYSGNSHMANSDDGNKVTRQKRILMPHLSALGITESPLFDINQYSSMSELIGLLEMMTLDATLDEKTKGLINAALEALDANQ